MIRNILNFNGEIIGTLELPDTTTEEEWQRRLAEYAMPIAHIMPNLTPRQLRQALFMRGLLTQVEATIEVLPEPTKTMTKISWEYSTAVFRNDPMIGAIGMMLGMNSQQIDDLWNEASVL